jgi:hypothetical protein
MLAKASTGAKHFSGYPLATTKPKKILGFA